MEMLSEREVIRYTRQLAMGEIGRDGQEKLKQSCVAVAGVGGLGSCSSLYLSALGVGKLIIIDNGFVQLSDLNRQVLYSEEDIGQKKTDLAYRKLSGLNPYITITSVFDEITDKNAGDLLKGAQIVVDGTDNFRTRKALNRACCEQQMPFVYGGIYGLKGTVGTFIPGRTACFECLCPDEPEVKKPIPVIGPTPAMIATIQVMEVLKLTLGMADNLSGKILAIDSQSMTFSRVETRRRAECQACSGIFTESNRDYEKKGALK